MFEFAVEKTDAAHENNVNSAGDESNNYVQWTDEKNVVSLAGLEAMISSFLSGIGDYSYEDIVDLFALVDADGSGYIDQDEFDQFMDLMDSKDEGSAKKEGRCKVQRAESLVPFVSELNLSPQGIDKVMDLAVDKNDGSAAKKGTRKVKKAEPAELKSSFNSCLNANLRQKSFHLSMKTEPVFNSIENLQKLAADKDWPLDEWSIFCEYYYLL